MMKPTQTIRLSYRPAWCAGLTLRDFREFFFLVVIVAVLPVFFAAIVALFSN